MHALTASDMPDPVYQARAPDGATSRNFRRRFSGGRWRVRKLPACRMLYVMSTTKEEEKKESLICTVLLPEPLAPWLRADHVEMMEAQAVEAVVC